MYLLQEFKTPPDLHYDETSSRCKKRAQHKFTAFVERF